MAEPRDRKVLFTGHVRIGSVVDRWEGAISKAIHSLPPAEVVRLTNELLIERILDATVDVPPELGPWRGTQHQYINEYRSAVVEFQMRAGVTGHVGLLEMLHVPMQSVDAGLDGYEICIATKHDKRPPDKIKDELERRAAVVERNVAAIKTIVADLRAKLRQKYLPEIQKLRETFLAGNAVFESLALPVARDPFAPMSPLRVEERVIVHRALSSAPSSRSVGAGIDQRTLEETAYEQIIDSCASMANTIKRSPRTFGKFWSQAKRPQIQETPFRDVFLVGLNASFKGLATGETFNFRGKTDVHIRVAERNLFIAEFKVWTGPASYKAAIDQVLDYVAWDDTKAAVVLFVGGQDYSAVLASIAAATRECVSCLVVSKVENEGQLIRWVARHPQDAARRVTMTTLALNIPDTVDDEE